LLRKREGRGEGEGEGEGDGEGESVCAYVAEFGIYPDRCFDDGRIASATMFYGTESFSHTRACLEMPYGVCRRPSVVCEGRGTKRPDFSNAKG
jgi:hypothetical protein